MNEITVTDLEGNVIAHVFIENGETQAIVHDGYIVNVDGTELT